MVLAACTSGRKTLEERIFELAADEDGFTAQDSSTVAHEGYGIDEKGLQVAVAEIQDSVIDKTERTVFIEMLHTTEDNFRKVFGENGTKVAKKRIDLFGDKLDPFWFWQKNPTIEQARGYLAKLNQMGDKEDQLVMLKNLTVEGEVKKLVDDQIKSVLRSIGHKWLLENSPRLIGNDVFKALKKLLTDETQDGETRFLALGCLEEGKGHFSPKQALEMLNYLCSPTSDEKLLKLLRGERNFTLQNYFNAIHAVFSMLDEGDQKSKAGDCMRAIRKMPLYTTGASDLPHDYQLAGIIKKLSEKDFETEKRYYFELFKASGDKQVKIAAAVSYLAILYHNGSSLLSGLLALREETESKDEDVLILASAKFEASDIFTGHLASGLLSSDFLKRLLFFHVISSFYWDNQYVRDVRDLPWCRELAKAIEKNPADKQLRYMLALLDGTIDVKTALAYLHETLTVPIAYLPVFDDPQNAEMFQRVAGIKAIWFIISEHPEYAGREDEIRYLRQWIMYGTDYVVETAAESYAEGVNAQDIRYVLPSDEVRILRGKVIKDEWFGYWHSFTNSFLRLAEKGLISYNDIVLTVEQALSQQSKNLELLAKILTITRLPHELAIKAIAKLKKGNFDFNRQFHYGVTAKEQIKTKQRLTDADF